MSGQSRDSKTTREWPGYPRQASGKEELWQRGPLSRSLTVTTACPPRSPGYTESEVSLFAKRTPGFLPLRSKVWYCSIQWNSSGLFFTGLNIIVFLKYNTLYFHTMKCSHATLTYHSSDFPGAGFQAHLAHLRRASYPSLMHIFILFRGYTLLQVSS